MHKVVLRKDTGKLCQLLQFKKPGHLQDLARLIFREIKDNGNVGTSFGKHHRTPVFSYLDIKLAQVGSRFREFVNEMQDSSAIELSYMANELLNGTRVGHTKHCLHLCQRDFISRVGNGLIQQAECIPHPPGGSPGNQLSSSSLYFDVLLPGNKVQMLNNVPRG